MRATPEPYGEAKLKWNEYKTLPRIQRNIKKHTSQLKRIEIAQNDFKGRGFSPKTEYGLILQQTPDV